MMRHLLLACSNVPGTWYTAVLRVSAGRHPTHCLKKTKSNDAACFVLVAAPLQAARGTNQPEQNAHLFY